MTTEIAVANRLGIALATDSAVTISRGGMVKVFDTADKLFELSAKHPVALMINGNMDCLGVPWEILVKDFRTTEGDVHRATIKQWTDDFLAYVESHVLIGDDSVAKYVEQIARDEIDRLQSHVSNSMFTHIFEPTKRHKDLRKARVSFDIFAALRHTIKMRRDELEEIPIATSLVAIDPVDISKAYAPILVPTIMQRFAPTPLTQSDVESLEEIIVEAMRRNTDSDFVAGIVVAGYGNDDMFPSLHTVEVDGRILGKLKVSGLQSESIAASADGGQVTYFAQTDVIQRLLGGADPRFVDRTAEFIETAVVQVADAVEKALRPKSGGRRSPKREKLLQDIIDVVITEYQEETTVNLREEFSREFDRMVAMMPKQELIELAEALVSITAVERKATSDAGTVGGPIDVAFITKHEGLVWIKRKHYFEKNLNPRYFWREYSNPATAVTQ